MTRHVVRLSSLKLRCTPHQDVLDAKLCTAGDDPLGLLEILWPARVDFLQKVSSPCYTGGDGGWV